MFHCLRKYGNVKINGFCSKMSFSPGQFLKQGGHMMGSPVKKTGLKGGKVVNDCACSSISNFDN